MEMKDTVLTRISPTRVTFVRVIKENMIEGSMEVQGEWKECIGRDVEKYEELGS